jgi:hypothetical protein
MNESGKRKVPQSAPRGLVRQRWVPHVFTGDEIDRCYYELCALSELRNSLRSGDVWVVGSRRYGDFESYLIPKESWPGIRERGAVGVAVKTDCATYLNERRDVLKEQLLRVASLADKAICRRPVWKSRVVVEIAVRSAFASHLRPQLID